MSLVVRWARLRAIGWLALPFLLVACSTGGSPTPPPSFAPTGTVAQPASPTIVATGGPRPSIATPTVPPTPPTATAPRATPATPATPPLASPVQATPSPAPLGTVPPGWQVYRGSLPFVIAYPPDWKVDESQLAISNSVYFFAPVEDQSVFLVIATTGAPEASPNLDVLRDQWFRSRTQVCTDFAIQETGQAVASGLTFATVGATCDLATGLAYSYTGLGLRGNVPWIFEFNAPYEGYGARVAEAFGPMLATLNIHGGFAGR
jgi:hypothetical protein